MTVNLNGVYALIVGFSVMLMLGAVGLQVVRWAHARRTSATVAALVHQQARHFPGIVADQNRVGDLYVSNEGVWFIAASLVPKAQGFLRMGAQRDALLGENTCTVTQVHWDQSSVAIHGTRMKLVPWNLCLYNLSNEACEAIGRALEEH